MENPVQQVKDRVDIVDLVKEYIALKQSGSNYKGPCPFHKEKSPSFMVSAQKQIWHCFGCGEGGDLFTFFTKIENIEFGEALRILATRAGVTLTNTSGPSQPRDVKERLYDLMDLAAGFFTQALIRAPQAQDAREYLEGRMLSKTTQEEFGFGYSLEDYDRLYQFLISKKYTTHEIVDVGLAIVKDRGRAIDRFRDRIMIPIRDIHGHTVGFGGRILHEKPDAPKYLNSPQTVLYDKSRVVFNLDRARHAIREKDQVVIVEGYMDVIPLVQAGSRNVVASCGTALTVEQIKLIKRFTQSFLFCFDADAAGVQATERGVDVALQEGIDARIVRLPQGPDGKPLYKDPGECIQKDPQAWADSVDQAMPFIEFLTRHEINAGALTDPNKKTKAVHKVLAFVVRISDRVMQDHWVTFLAKEMNVSERVLWEELDTMQKRNRTPFRSVQPANQQPKPASKVSVDPIEFSFIVSLFKNPSYIPEAAVLVEPTMIASQPLSALYNALVKDYSDNTTSLPSAQAVVEGIDPSLAQTIDAAVAFQDESDYTVLPARVRSRYKERRLRELQHLMATAESRHDSQAVAAYLAEFQIIQAM